MAKIIVPILLLAAVLVTLGLWCCLRSGGDAEDVDGG